jgi:hypothetical protein
VEKSSLKAVAGSKKVFWENYFQKQFCSSVATPYLCTPFAKKTVKRLADLMISKLAD